MAQSQSGKWVAKVGSTGGGKSYRSQRPTNFYAAIAAIVNIGLVSVFFARHEYQSNRAATTTTGVTPIAGSTTFASLAFDVCGKLQPSLAASPSTTPPLTAQADGVVKLAPKTAAEAGTNATVARFAKDYPGLTISSNKLVLPASGGTVGGTWTNGSACPASTPDAGKKGRVVISYWPNFATTKATLTSSDPGAVHFSSNGLVTVAFVPEGATVLRPSSTTIQKMLVAAQSTATSPTTTAATGSTTTAATGSTTTTAASTPSTTAKPTTTTTKK